MDQLNCTHLAYGVFLCLIITFFLWKNRRKGHRLIKEIAESLRTSIDSFHLLTFSEFYGLPQGCALKTDEWHVGYTLYFACDSILGLDSIVGILITDLVNDHSCEVIHKQDIVAHHERQVILLKKGSRTFKMYVTHGVGSDEKCNLFSVHIELNNR